MLSTSAKVGIRTHILSVYRLMISKFDYLDQCIPSHLANYQRTCFFLNILFINSFKSCSVEPTAIVAYINNKSIQIFGLSVWNLLKIKTSS